MADKSKSYTLRDEELGTVRIADDLLPVIAALAATEVDGVASMAGNITHDIVRAMGIRNLAQGVRTEVSGNEVRFDLSLNVDYERSIALVSREVQERVKNAVETMTGMTVTEVRVRVADIDLQSSK